MLQMTLPATTNEQAAAVNGNKDAEGLPGYLRRLIRERGYKSYRAASLALYEGRKRQDASAFHRWIEKGTVPSPASCKLIGRVFGRTGAERQEIETRLLTLAGHITPQERAIRDADVPPELKELVEDLKRVPKDKRQEIVEQLRRLIDLMG